MFGDNHLYFLCYLLNNNLYHGYSRVIFYHAQETLGLCRPFGRHSYNNTPYRKYTLLYRNHTIVNTFAVKSCLSIRGFGIIFKLPKKRHREYIKVNPYFAPKIYLLNSDRILQLPFFPARLPKKCHILPRTIK